MFDDTTSYSKQQGLAQSQPKLKDRARIRLLSFLQEGTRMRDEVSFLQGC